VASSNESSQLHIVKDPNHRSNSNEMQLILDTQRAPAADRYVIRLQLCRSLEENNADKHQ